MKLLLDENLSRRIVKALASAYPGSVHVSHVGLLQTPDEKIRAFARQHGYAVATKNMDFEIHSMMHGTEPFIVQLKGGNESTAAIIEKLLTRREDIERAYNAPDQYNIEIS